MEEVSLAHRYAAPLLYALVDQEGGPDLANRYRLVDLALKTSIRDEKEHDKHPYYFELPTVQKFVQW
jgi:hypothetical protein